MLLEFPKAAFIDLEARFLQRVSQRPVAFLACLVRGRAEYLHHVSQLSQVRHLGHIFTVRRFIPMPCAGSRRWSCCRRRRQVRRRRLGSDESQP